MQSSQPTESVSPLKSALAISIGYLVFGALWVLVTDPLVYWLFPNRKNEFYAWINTYKGWFFMLISGAWIYLIVHRRMRRVLTFTQVMERGRDRMRRILQAAREGIWILDSNLLTTYINPEMARMLHKTPDELQGQTIEQFIHPSSLPAWKSLLNDPTEYAPSKDIQFVAPDGGDFWGIVRVSQGLVDPTIEWLVMVNDITDRRKNEEQIRRAQRLESIGRLAAGVAHDFNNLLAIILGYSDSMARNMPPNSPHAEHVAEIQKASERGVDLVKRLLAFARSQKEQRVVIDLPHAINDLFPMLKRLVPKNIQMTWSPPEKPLQITVGSGQIEHMLINLVVNAMEASPKSIRIAASQQLFTESDAKTVGLAPGNYACLEVSDTGAGMDEQTRAHVFEPFFTTKKGKNTGLGLSVVASIVHDCAGQISVDSDPDRGTAFRIWIPLHPPYLME